LQRKLIPADFSNPKCVAGWIVEVYKSACFWYFGGEWRQMLRLQASSQ